MSDLAEFAEQQDWLTNVSGPDFFNEVRVSCMSAAGDRILMVFNKVGKLAGAYFADRDDPKFTRRTDRVGDVKGWLSTLNGAVE